MNKGFHIPVAGELQGFLQFKRSLGYGYARAEFALREFDRFLSELLSKPERKLVTVSGRCSDSPAVLCLPAPTAQPAGLWNRSGHNRQPSPPSFRIFFPNRTF
jgi:hypothetical protein